MKPRSLVIPCSCHSPIHNIIIKSDDEFVELQTFLAPLPFHQRAWLAFKYVFGLKSVSAHFEETLLDESACQDLMVFLMSRFHYLASVKKLIDPKIQPMSKS